MGFFALISEVQKSLALKVNRQLALETLMLEMRKNWARKLYRTQMTQISGK